MSKSLTDLEIYETFVAAYPEKFGGKEESDELFEEVLEFANSLEGFEDISVLLGRIVMLTHPMKSGLTGRLWHCFGAVEIKGDQVSMTACVTREVPTPKPWCKTMDRPKDECGCPDCGSSLVQMGEPQS
tara:strand:- start:12518 stop:12904 length:387 start_codon:yes stop_codon:yes gene_type:complete